MSEPLIGEIRIFAGTFPPAGWAMCDGQLLPISQYPALYMVIGTNYGGDGLTTFGLPNLQGRVPLQAGQGSGMSNHGLGQTGGEQAVTLTVAQVPAHTHAVNANSGSGNQNNPLNNVWAVPHSGRSNLNLYAPTPGANPPAMNAGAFAASGDGKPHNNLPPYLTLNFIIALQGLFPARG